MSEIGTGYTDGDYESSDFYNGDVASHDVSVSDETTGQKNRIRAKTINDLAAEIVGIETRLGSAVYGDKSTLKARLAMAIETDGSVFGVRCTRGFSDLEACLKNDTGSFVAGVIVGEAGATESLDLTDDDNYYSLVSNTHLIMPRDWTLSRTRTADASEDPQAAPIFYASGKDDISIDGGIFEGNAADNDHYTENDHCFHFENCTRVVIRNARIKNHAGDAIYLKNCDDVLIENCIIENPNVNAAAPLIGRYGVRIEDTDGSTNRIKVRNCVIKAHTGIYVDGSGANIDFEDNVIYSCNNEGIYGNGLSELRVRGGRLINNTGCGFQVVNQNTHVTLDGVLIRDNDLNGVYILSESGSESSFVTVNGCIIEDNGTADTVKAGIKMVYTDKLSIVNCRFQDTGDSEQSKPGDLSNCDNGLYHGNVSVGMASNALATTDCTAITEADNITV